MIGEFRDEIFTAEAIGGVFDEHFSDQIVEFTGHLLLETTLPHLSDQVFGPEGTRPALKVRENHRVTLNHDLHDLGVRILKGIHTINVLISKQKS